MKGLTMLTVVINALVQLEEMVTVITCLYYMCLNSLNWNVHNSKHFE